MKAVLIMSFVLLTILASTAGASSLVGYIVGDVDGKTVESLLAHNIPVKRVCSCTCRMINESVIVLVQNGKPLLVVESGAVFNGTIPPARAGRIPFLERNGTIVYVDTGKYVEFVKCVSIYRCVEIDRRETALLLLTGGAVLMLTVYIYNRKSGE